MGRRNKSYSKDLHEQAYAIFKKMFVIGEKKSVDRAYDRAHGTNIQKGKIYHSTTYKAYWKHTKYFLKWINKNHPECKTLKKAKKYVNEWLQYRVDSKLSAYTIHLEEAALNKLYGIDKDDPKRFQPPQRRKEDIVRSRGPKIRDKHFSEKKNEELVSFCKCCGFRRGVLENLRGKDLYDRPKIEEILKNARAKQDDEMIKICTDALKTFPDQDYFIFHYDDKGGKSRVSPIVGPERNREMVIRRMKETPAEELVWQYVNSNCDVHGYRANYATYLYKMYARPIETLNFKNKMKCADGKYRSEVYICRKNEKGKRLDRRGIRIVSIALGHDREDTAIANYIRNI